MIASEKTSWLIPISIAAGLTILFGLFAVNPFPTQTRDKPQEFDYAGRQTQGITVKQDQLILTRNKRVTIGRNALVFKGTDKDNVLIDLYLLDMDPEQPYRKEISKKDAKKEMILGSGRYRLLSVNGNNLILRNYPKKQQQ